MSIKYYQLAKDEELPDEFCAVRDVGGEPSEYVFYVPEAENAKLRELVRDMLPFAEVGFEDACPTTRCCLFVECDAVSGSKCRVEAHMSQRLHDLGVKVDG